MFENYRLGNDQEQRYSFLALPRLALPLSLALAVLASGCGHAKKPAAGPIPGTALEARLRGHGYTVTNIASSFQQPYERAFSVPNVDFTSPRSFSVTVFIFDSKAKAQTHSAHTAGLVGHFPWTNRSKLVGPYLFVATEDAAGGQCTMVNGSPHCPRSPGVPVGDFDKLVSIAVVAKR